MNPNKKQSAYLVISDSSSYEIEKNQNNFVPKQNQSQYQDVEERPIRLRKSDDSRQNVKINSDDGMISFKSSKKVKLSQDPQQQEGQGLIIRFDRLKQDKSGEQPEQSVNIVKKKLKKALPWVTQKTRQIEDVCLRFHNEVAQFYEYIKPTKNQHQSRLNVFKLVKDMILLKYPKAKVQVFGSFATKLYLPDGDIDVTVLIQEDQYYSERIIYDNLYKIIKKHDGSIFSEMQYIRNSKVPLIKFTHVDTQYQFDISVNKTDGLKQIEHVQRMRKNYPEFDPLAFVLKTALKIRNMSQTYTGGIGSFLLFCMILHFLRYVHTKQYYYTLGEYVMKFMEFYGMGEWERKSIYARDGTQVQRAREPGTLSLYSPQDQSHDIGKSAYKIRDTFNVFKNRFRVISGKQFSSQESILKQIINPALEEFRYYRYEKSLNKKAE